VYRPAPLFVVVADVVGIVRGDPTATLFLRLGTLGGIFHGF
jgi:hypothetical protein